MEHRGDDWEPLLVVGVKERRGSPAFLNESELPGEIELESKLGE